MVELFEHQKKALEMLKSGSILCGGTGSGKSLTSIAYFYTRECGGDLRKEKFGHMTNPKDLYIITTARKRDSLEWEKECAMLALSTDKERSIGHIKVTIDSWNNIHKYEDISGAFFIFDEQRVVSYGSWSKCFIQIARNNRWILLSATPGDCWMDYIPVFIANGFYKNKTEFVRRHVQIEYNRYTNFPRIKGYYEEKHLNRLRNSIMVFMPYRMPTEQHHENIVVPYDREKYDIVMKNRWNPYTDSPIEDISGLCQTIRKVVNSDPSRCQTIIELMKDHPKVIIFYNYDYELELLRSLPFPKAEWNGHKHEPIPVGENWAYLVQYAAGAEGWNCIETDTIIFYSQSYSYKMSVQAAGRIDRLNTPYRDLYYYHLMSKSKIDIAISRALLGKQNFNESAFIGHF